MCPQKESILSYFKRASKVEVKIYRALNNDKTQTARVNLTTKK